MLMVGQLIAVRDTTAAPLEQVTVGLELVKFHEAGAVTVIESISYALVVGLATVMVNPGWAPPTTRLWLRLSVGRLAFVVACAGAANGTRNRIPDSASNASIVPELNLLRYIDDVFNRRMGMHLNPL